MPPQKNTGNRGAKRETGVSFKNKKFIQDFIEDARKDGQVDEIFIGRVTKKMGNGRMEVFYVEKDHPKLVSSIIRGTFRGRGKHSVWIDVGSYVAIAATGVGGSLAYEIVAVLSIDQVREISQHIELDPRIIDATAVSSIVEVHGFEFDNKSEEEVDVDNI